jgi:hypothetical protein
VIHLARTKLLSALAFDVYDELARYHVHEHVAGVVMPTAHPANWKLDPEDCAFFPGHTDEIAFENGLLVRRRPILLG